MHVEGMAVNSGVRQHHPSIRPGSGYDLFFKVAPGRFRLWDEATDPAPIYRTGGAAAIDQQSDDEDVDEDIEREVSGGAREFAYERDLRNYLAKNLSVLERGLRFIDILAIDAAGGFVVIELKVSRGYDRSSASFSATWLG